MESREKLKFRLEWGAGFMHAISVMGEWSWDIILEPSHPQAWLSVFLLLLFVLGFVCFFKKKKKRK